MICPGYPATYDDTGFVDYLDVFNDAVDNFAQMVTVAGGLLPLMACSESFDSFEGGRADNGLVDLPARAGYSISGIGPSDDSHAQASEYYQVSVITVLLSVNSTKELF